MKTMEKQSVDIIPETLISRCLDAYWDREFGCRGISSNYRMAKVFSIISEEIRSWAPSESSSRMNVQTINEIADRLLELACNDTI